MDDVIISDIFKAAAAQPESVQQRWIAERVIKTQRAADAAVSDEALQAELDAWFQLEYGHLPGQIFSAGALGWARHLLSGVRHA
jgi:hypothetical protein